MTAPDEQTDRSDPAAGDAGEPAPAADSPTDDAAALRQAQAEREAHAARQAARAAQLAALRALDDEALRALADQAAESAKMRLLAQRVRAEADNQRKRAETEREQLRLYYKREVLAALVPVLANLESALKAGEAATSDEARHFCRGFQALREQFIRALEAMGCTALAPAPGTPFNPTEHEALLTVPTAEHPPQTILEVLEVGYRAGDRVLRAARVTVAVTPPAPAS